MRYFLEQCLLSVQAACKNITYEIIVVDNNSQDKSCAMVIERFPEIQLISNKVNVGFAKANNQGFQMAKGEYVLILNPDTVIAEDTLEKCIAFADNQNNPGAIGVRFIDGSGKFLPESKRNIPTVKVANQKLRGITKNYYANQFHENEIVKVEVLTGAFMLIKNDVYRKTGGFDEDYFMYGEDIDLSYKLLKMGYDNYYFGETTVVHYKGESTKKDQIYLKNFYGAMQLFYTKHFSVNLIFKFILFNGFKLLIFLKSKNLYLEKQVVRKNKKFVYIGKNTSLFQKLSNLKHFEASRICSSIPDEIDFDTIIFDADFLSFKEIIACFQRNDLRQISKRIIPSKTSFYIGSDLSTSRGEVQKF